MNEPRPYYQITAQENTERAAALQKRYDRLALVRLVAFFVWLAAVIVLFRTNLLWGGSFLLLTIPLIAWAVRKHLAIKHRAAAARVMADLASMELDALDHNFSGLADGSGFLNLQHPYALDLDIFGPASLFQFVNRTVTAPGTARLAVALAGEHPKEESASTRVQGKVLAAMPDWCLRFRTIGHDLKDDIRYFDRLLDWLRQPAVVTGRIDLLILPLAPLLTLLALATMFLITPWQIGVLGLLPAGWMLRKYNKIVQQAHEHTAEMGQLLKTYAELLAQAETRPAAPALPGNPQKALTRLSYLVSQLDVRYNPFVLFLEVGGLWSLQWLRKLDQWRLEHREHLPAWLAALAEADTLVSWATLRFNHPDWTDPEFTDQPVVEA
ncbi:MAG: hypothetical protein AAF840_03965, partial [Bacteroidota bacterium]